jgi:S1-C subfamily serine protease
VSATETIEIGAARRFAGAAADLVDRVRRAVVEVRSEGGAGAGIVWGGSGLVVTNAHCAPRDARLQLVQAERTHGARTIAYHPRHDLALLASATVRGPLLDVRSAATLRVGELVFAYGHPLGVSDALAMGVIHAVARDERTGGARFIVADVHLAPGNSGGPLVDSEGLLVGINSMVVNGLGVAIPADTVARFVERATASRVA